MKTNPLVATVTNILRSYRNEPVTPKRASGCGCVYVCLSGSMNTETLKYEKVKPEVVKAVAKAAEATGMIFQRKAHYGFSNALYVGYDNADGRALALGELLAQKLTDAGIKAYMDAGAD